MAGTVLVRFLGDASSVKKAAGETSTAIGGVDRATTAATTSLTNYAQGLPGMGLAASAGFGKAQMAAAGAAAGAAVAGAALAKFALDGVNQFRDLAAEVDNLQDVTGSTAEEASKFVAISRAVGVESEQVAGAIFKMSKSIRDNAEAFEANGVEIARNNQGGVDLTQTLLNVGDAYRETAAKGGDANKILTDAFGRGGAAMIDILERSRAELDGFLTAAEEHGQILSDEDLSKAREFEVATRELNEAFGEMQREVGSALIPMLTRLAETITFVTDKMDALGVDVSTVTTEIIKQIPGLGTLVSAYEAFGGGADDAAGSSALLAAAVAHATQEMEEHASATARGWEALAKYNTVQQAAIKVQDDAIDSLLDARDAARDHEEAIDELTIATRDGQQADESAADFKDRLSGSLDGVVRSMRPVLDALVAEGSVTNDVSGRTSWLVDRLEELKGQYPHLANEINRFIYTALQAAARSGAIGYQIGVDFAANLQRGLVDGERRVVGSADSLAHHIEDTVNGRLNIPSPAAVSGVGVRAGSAVTSGIAQGMSSQKDEVEEEVEDIADILESAIDNLQSYADARDELMGARKSVAELEAEQAALPGRIEMARGTIARHEREMAVAEQMNDPARFERARERRDAAREHLNDLARRQRQVEEDLARARSDLNDAALNASTAPITPGPLTSEEIDRLVMAGTANGVTAAELMQLVAAINALASRPVEVVVDGQRLGKAITPSVRTELIQIGKRNGGNVLAGMA